MIFLAVLLCAAMMPMMAQQQDGGVTIDYNNPKKYIVGGVTVEGNSYFGPDQIIQAVASALLRICRCVHRPSECIPGYGFLQNQHNRTSEGVEMDFQRSQKR